MTAPGQSDRQGISLAQLFRMFPDDATAEAWFCETRWPDGPACPHCESSQVQTGAAHKTMPMRCRDCRKRFSVRTGTAMQGSNLGYQTWAIAIYLITTSLKGVSSMKLHRDLGITQKSAWHLAHRIRQAWAVNGEDPFEGPVEVDETFVGGKAHNMHETQRDRMRQADYPKAPIVGVRDRATGQVSARAVEITDAVTLREFVREHTKPGAQVYSDGHKAYRGLDGEYRHKAVQHAVGTYVIGDAHTNAIESFWSMFKRGYVGTYHRMSPKHLDRYAKEFAGRHNQRSRDTIEQMRRIARGLVGKRLRYDELTA